MVKNLQLSDAADPFLDYTKDDRRHVKKSLIFERRADLFVFGAAYGRYYRLYEDIEIIPTGMVKEPIRFHIFEQTNSDIPLALIAYGHFQGDLEKFKDPDLCRKVLERYAHFGLEKFYNEIKKGENFTDAYQITDYYTSEILTTIS